jgi:hypothetical protein
MLCQSCGRNEALVHISVASTRESFWRACADAYYISNAMNSSRDLIQLSDFYRAKLYDELELRHPEVFDNSNDEACLRGTEVMCRFLKKRLTEDNIELNEDGFDMLCHDFFGSHLFYERAEKINASRSGNHSQGAP